MISRKLNTVRDPLLGFHIAQIRRLFWEHLSVEDECIGKREQSTFIKTKRVSLNRTAEKLYPSFRRMPLKNEFIQEKDHERIAG